MEYIFVLFAFFSIDLKSVDSTIWNMHSSRPIITLVHVGVERRDYANEKNNEKITRQNLELGF